MNRWMRRWWRNDNDAAGYHGDPICTIGHDIVSDGVGRNVVHARRVNRADVEIAHAIRFNTVGRPHGGVGKNVNVVVDTNPVC